MAVTPDGKQAVSVSDEQTLKVRDLATGTLIATFTCDALARCCVFAGGRKIVAVSGWVPTSFPSNSKTATNDPNADSAPGPPAFRFGPMGRDFVRCVSGISGIKAAGLC